MANRKGPAFDNQTKASELAGYKGAPGSNQLAVQGHRNMKNPTIRRTVEEELDKAGCTLEHGARRLKEGMDARRRKSFLATNGEVVYSEAEPDYAERRLATKLMFRLQGEPRPRSQPTSFQKGTQVPEQCGPITINPQEADPELIKQLQCKAANMTPSERMLVGRSLNMMLRKVQLEIEARRRAEASGEKLEPPNGKESQDKRGS